MRSFTKALYLAKTYREVKNLDPQLFITLGPPLCVPGVQETFPVEQRAVPGQVYAFPWRNYGLLIDAVFIRYWFDETSGELRYAYLNPRLP